MRRPSAHGAGTATGRRRRAPRAALLALLAALLLSLAPAAAPATAQTAQPARADLVDLEDEVMCIVCGRPLSTSGGDAADDQRTVIQGLIDEGLTKGEVKDRLVAEYGERVLVKGSSPVAAAAPAVAALAGALSILLLLRRRRAGAARRERGAQGAAPAGGPDADGAPVVSAADDARIDAELSERG